MKYTMAKNGKEYRLMRHGELAQGTGDYDNAHLEFWLKIDELMERIKELEAARDFHIKSTEHHVEKARTKIEQLEEKLSRYAELEKAARSIKVDRGQLSVASYDRLKDALAALDSQKRSDCSPT